MKPGPAWPGSSGITRVKGLTLLELVLGIAILAGLGLVLLPLLKGSILLSGRSAEEVFLLSNARKVLTGSGPFKGILWKTQQAARVMEADPKSLSLVGPDEGTMTYLLSGKGELVELSPVTNQVRATGLEGLSFSYFARDDDFHVYETTSPAAASLLVLSFSLPAKARKIRFLSGAKLENHR